MKSDRAGYSRRSLVDKLGFKEGHRFAIVAPPPGIESTLGLLPEGVRRARATSGSLDVIILFALDVATLKRQITNLKRALAPNGMLWVCWPKKSSGFKTRLGETMVRETGLASGLVDVKVCAIDFTWSGLKFVYRLRDRPKAATPRRARQKS
jgi:hypothetical protein